jgi:hypothetical protein
MGAPPHQAQLRSVISHVHIVAETLEPRLGTAIPAMHRRGTGMPLGDREGTMQSPIAMRMHALLRPSGTLPPEPANAGPCIIYDARAECARQSTGPIEISMTRESHGRGGRWPAHGSAQCERAVIAEIRLPPFNEPGVRAPFDRNGGGSGAGGQRGQRGQGRASRSWMRRPTPRRKYSTHEQIPTPRVGQSCGATPSPQITPISRPFPGDCSTWACVSGPLAGDIGRGPDTGARGPGGTPPNSQGKSAHTRCVVGWVESGYVKRGAHDTRHLSSCLVTPTSISRLMAGSSGGR